MNSELFLPTDAFIRSVGTHHPTPYSLLLGAGASVSSGVLSAEQCLWTWKRDIVVSNNPGLESHFTELSLASVRERIQDWLDADGAHPPSGTKGEYEHFAAQAYPIAEDRRQFFERLVERAAPNTGYQLLCLLAQARVFHSVWTTNFDGMVARAGAMTGTTVFEIGIDSSSRVDRPARVGALRQISLHGDYRYDALKNTAAELRTRDQTLHAAFADALRHDSLLVVGYSGRDAGPGFLASGRPKHSAELLASTSRGHVPVPLEEPAVVVAFDEGPDHRSGLLEGFDASIMQTLTDGYATAGSGRLFWCLYGDEQPSSLVERLIIRARSAGREAHIVRTDGFDDLMLRFSRFVLEGELHDRATAIVSASSSENGRPTPFRVSGSAVRALLKSNAFPMEPPGELLQFDASGYDTPGAWARLRARVQGHDVVAGLVKGKVLALGLVDDVRHAFEDQLQGEIVRTGPAPFSRTVSSWG